MKDDIIKCLNPFCGREFKDTTKLKMQDSRNGKFVNMCPYCYGINTMNTDKNAKRKNKFIYDSDTILEDTHLQTKIKKRIRKPNLSTKYIAIEVLGNRKECDISEDAEKFSEDYGRTVPRSEGMSIRDFVENKGGTYNVALTKPYTPQELKQQEINNHVEEMKSSPNNYEHYKGWWHKRHKK